MITKLIRKPPWFKVWSAITAIALTAALLLTFLPYQVDIGTGGFLSISFGQKASAQEPAQSSIRPGFGWAPIDFTTYAGGFTAGQIYNATFPNNINSGSGVSYSYANYTLTYHLSGGKMQWTSTDGAETKSIGAALSSTGAIQPDGEHNKVAYANAFLNTAVEYRAYSIGVKEVFVLSDLPANDGKIADLYLEYTGELTWDSGLSVWVDGIEYPDKTFTTNSSVDFRDIATNETVFSFLAPIAWDSAGSRCSGIYDVKVSADKVQYGLRVPYSWLQTATFPVTIDPSFTARTEEYFNASSLATPYDATVSKPSGTAQDDILFALICWSANSIDAVPSGWASLGSHAATFQYALYYKVAGASEPGSYTWSFSGSAKVRIVCSCYTGGAFDVSDPIDVVSNTAYAVNNAIVRAAAMTVTAANSPLVFFASMYQTSSATFTKPSTPTTDWVEDDDSGSTVSDFWNEVASMVWAGSGTTANMDATATLASTYKHAFAVALNPAAAEPEITNIPDNYGFGILQLGTTVATAINYFTLNNTGDCAVDITIQGTDLTGGDDTWTLSDTATPGENIYGLRASTDSETLYEYYDTGDDSYSTCYGDSWKGQTFTPSSAHTITSVALKIYKIGNPGDATVAIRATSAGLPTGNDLCSGTIAEASIPSSPGDWAIVTLDTAYPLSASSQYAIVMRAPSGDVNNAVATLLDASSPAYSGGLYVYSTTGGSTWTSHDGSDLMFKEYGVDFDVIVKKTATYNTLVSNLATNTTQGWTLALIMPTSLSGYDVQQMSGTITLVASAA